MISIPLRFLNTIQFVQGARTHAHPLHPGTCFCVFRDFETVNFGGVDSAVRDTFAQLFWLDGWMVGKWCWFLNVCFCGCGCGGFGGGWCCIGCSGGGRGGRRLVLKLIQFRCVFRGDDAREQISIALVEQMWESCSEESPIYTVKSRTWWAIVVDTVGAEQLDRIQPGQIAPTTRQDGMTMTKHPRAVPEMSGFILVHHLLHSMPRQNVSLMNQTVEQLGGGFDNGNVGNFERVFLGWLYVEDHLESFFVERDEGVETGKVEIVFDKVFSNFGKVFVPG